MKKMDFPDWVVYTVAALLLGLVIAVIVLTVNVVGSTDCSRDRVRGDEDGTNYTTQRIGHGIYFIEDARSVMIGRLSRLRSDDREECFGAYIEAWLGAELR